MKKIIKNIFIGLFVSVVILWGLNFLSIIIYRTIGADKPINKYAKIEDGHFTDLYNDARASLPNYKNIRWAKKHFAEYDDLKCEFQSFVGWRPLQFKGETINIDEHGIRNTPQSDYVSQASPVVAFFGGSAMWGAGANDSNTIPSLFSQLAKGQYRTINFAQAGYNSSQSNISLQLQIMRGLRPAVVVTYDGFNDGYFMPAEVENRPGHANEAEMITRMEGQDPRTSLYYSKFFFAPVAGLATVLSSKNPWSKDAVKYSPQQLLQTAKGLLESWLITKQWGDENGFYFLAALQPNAYTGHPRTDYLVKLSAKDNQYGYYSILFDLLKEKRYQELSDHILDLTKAFDEDEYIYIDDVHVSPNGNAIIAQKIYDHIATIKLKH